MRRSLLALPVLTALLALTACGGSAEPDAAPAPDTASASSPSASPSTSPSTSPYEQYVALGDSYTAAPFVPLTDVSSICLRSSANYPALVAEQMPGTTLTDVSCSGATTADVTQRQVGLGGQSGSVPPQLDAVGPDTDLVTIGLGGNDEGLFGTVLGQCVQSASADPAGTPCTDSFAAQGAGALDATFTTIEDNIAEVVRAVDGRAPRARVLVVGYPQIVPASGTCDLLPLAAGDYAFARDVNRRLNDALRAGATRAGAEYVDVWASSAGHDICGAVPWINGPVTSADTALAFHPLAAGQAAVAGLVLGALG